MVKRDEQKIKRQVLIRLAIEEYIANHKPIR